eukprot:11061825-Lingulodinium_polyedra.AAC.1
MDPRFVKNAAVPMAAETEEERTQAPGRRDHLHDYGAGPSDDLRTGRWQLRWRAREIATGALNLVL